MNLPRNFFDDFASYADEAVSSTAADMAALCQSPIEVAFAVAFIHVLRLHGYPVAVFDGPSGTLVSHEKLSGFIAPQTPILTYRADFVVGIRMGDGFVAQMVVECDGHEFHNLTKEQASRDRRRDREMQEANWRVFRFTESEIHKSAFDCAHRVVMALLKMAGDGAGR